MTNSKRGSSAKNRSGMIVKKASFSIYDMKYEEAWLNALANEGLMLHEVKAALHGKKYFFDKTDSKNLRYGIIPKKMRKISDEEQELYRAAGWNPICEKGYTYYYSDEPDAGELFSDEDSYRTYHRAFFKSLLFSLVVCIFAAVIFLGNIGLKITGSYGMESFARTSLISDLGHILIYAGMIAYNLVFATYLIIRRREYKSGKYEELHKALKKQKIVNVSVTVLAALVIISLAMIFITGRTELSKNEVATYSEARPVLMREAFPDEWSYVDKRIKEPETEAIIPAGDGHGRLSVYIDYDYDICKTKNIFLEEGYIEEIYVGISSVSPLDEAESEEAYEAEGDFIANYHHDAPEYASLYYVFRSEEQAERTLTKAIENELKYAVNSANADSVETYLNQSGKVLKGEAALGCVKIDVQGADYAGFIDERSPVSGINQGGRQYLYLRKGNKIVYVSYSGRHNLTDKIPLFANQLR
ncbi:MAG: DUF2812 domain-containing protein [Mogibacterium sp.]|nr:DUF2812 domain-containing protein [Mogibacterium sp.]